MSGDLGLVERRHQMVAACEAVDGLGAELWRAGSVELEAVMAEADRLGAAAMERADNVIRTLHRSNSSGARVYPHPCRMLAHHWAASASSTAQGSQRDAQRRWQTGEFAPPEDARDRLPELAAYGRIPGASRPRGTR